MKTFEDEVRSVIESNTNPPYNKAQALRLYVEQSVLDDRVSEDMDTYRVALEATGGTFGGVEPVSRFHEAFHAPIDAAYAAAVVGLQTDTFLERVRENTGLQNVGLLALDNPNGSVKRDTWTSSFRDIISALDYPQQVGEPSDITQPDILPGGQVHIPDPILRAAIADELGKSINVPITLDEMKRLKRLDVPNRGIRDLTGLQFATNLSDLDVNRNQISDISPVRHLTNLTALVLHHTSVSDLSPVAGLINLRHLDLGDANVSDLSPVARLINLEFLYFPGNPISDLSPTSGLINLKRLWFWDANISDLSPIAGLVNLRRLWCQNNHVSDLSPIAGLVNLRRLWCQNNHVSDLSPIAGLTNLEDLHFTGNEVTDIAPLADLINLVIFNSWGNRFSDLSPLARLTNLQRIDICGARLEEATLAPLAGLTNLKELYLAGNGISDISGIARLTGLTRLGLHGNNISDISPVVGLNNLKWLNLHGNKNFGHIAACGINKFDMAGPTHQQNLRPFTSGWFPRKPKFLNIFLQSGVPDGWTENRRTLVVGVSAKHKAEFRHRFTGGSQRRGRDRTENRYPWGDRR